MAQRDNLLQKHPSTLRAVIVACNSALEQGTAAADALASSIDASTHYAGTAPAVAAAWIDAVASVTWRCCDSAAGFALCRETGIDRAILRCIASIAAIASSQTSIDALRRTQPRPRTGSRHGHSHAAYDGASVAAPQAAEPQPQMEGTSSGSSSGTCWDLPSNRLLMCAWALQCDASHMGKALSGICRLSLGALARCSLAVGLEQVLEARENASAAVAGLAILAG